MLDMRLKYSYTRTNAFVYTNECFRRVRVSFQASSGAHQSKPLTTTPSCAHTSERERDAPSPPTPPGSRIRQGRELASTSISTRSRSGGDLASGSGLPVGFARRHIGGHHIILSARAGQPVLDVVARGGLRGDGDALEAGGDERRDQVVLKKHTKHIKFADMWQERGALYGENGCLRKTCTLL